jgi:UDP-N-acetylmuramoyl-tripeptide--D-alanyl-D-alanine ligase
MMTVAEAAQALQFDDCNSDVLFTGISTDSRTVKPGDLFIALTGENFDGFQFVAGAVEKGAVAAIVKRQSGRANLAATLPVIPVDDTRLALGQLAAYWRKKFSLPLIAITGSNGKTTVKEMIALILREQVEAKQDHEERVLATEGNLNNEIGVPLMLLRLRQCHTYAVIEMGMNHAGEIDYLTRLARPNVAVITNVGVAHIEGLGSVEAIARAKGEIFEGLDQTGIAIINADDPYAPLWRQQVTNKQVVEFSLTGKAQVSASEQSGAASNQIKLNLPDGRVQVTLQVPGKHNVLNALAAVAVAVALGIKKQVIASGLEKFKGVNGRMQKKQVLHQAIVIDDSYNANPTSVQAAIAVLAETTGKKIMVLGDMGELGEQAADFHQQVGRQARLAGLDQIFTLGQLSVLASDAFGEGGRHFKCMEELIKETKQQLAPDTTVLVKGSRFMQMEQLVKQLEVAE